MLDFVESCSHRYHRTPFVRIVRQEMEAIGAWSMRLQERAKMFTELLSQRIPRRRRMDLPSSKWETASPAFILVMIEGDCESVTFPRLVPVHCVGATALYEFGVRVVSTNNGTHYRVIIRKGESEFAEINDGVVSDGRHSLERVDAMSVKAHVRVIRYDSTSEAPSDATFMVF